MGVPTPFNKAIVGFTFALAIIVIALSIIGITATSSGPFNAIVQLGTTTNGSLLGISIVVFILDLIWIAALSKKTREQSVSQSEPSQPGYLEHEPTSSALVSAIEEINSTDFLSKQPKEIIFKIFCYLNPIELTKCCELSRRWRRLASDATLWNAFDLEKIFPLLKIFDESDWVAHVNLSSFGLDVTDVPPLDKRTVFLILKKHLSSLPIFGNAGVTLLTIPKGLTFNKLVKLAGSPKMGNITRFRPIWDPKNEIGDSVVDKTYRIIITNNYFKNSRFLSVSDQKALVNKIGCEMPRALEVSVLLVVTFMSSGERLYSCNIYSIFTRCSDQVCDCQLSVGFSRDGVDVMLYDNIGTCDVGGVLWSS